MIRFPIKNRGLMVTKIISGGQTGVDRAALDVAIELGLPCGGWCPRGRRAEDGRLPDHYPLLETSSASYRERTRLNVQDSDGTLVISGGKPRGGTALTISWAKRLKKPVLRTNKSKFVARNVLQWIDDNKITVLNIAGPRESQNPGIYSQTIGILRGLLASAVKTAQ